ncbi:hypothetical protein [Acinetobacter gyllenbergii]|uniref:hypothetical protein n=1 Tax=Acinetobacter gyllenbergii TaxID=134534 RepID=UPI002420446E|nr:hypothetical protein [Acinetobacter gyllenbergii]
MMQQLSDLQFLQYFISDALYPRCNQDDQPLKDFYSQHWQRFAELSVKADKILNQEELIQLYSVVLHLKCSIKLKAQNYSIFIEAYRQYLSDFGSVLNVYDVREPLFLYGFDQFNPLAQGHSFEQYEKLRKLYTRIESYTSIRGHLKKMDFFKQQQGFAEYALQCLEHMSQYDFYCEDNQLVLGLKIRAMALLALFNPQYQAIFLEKFLHGDYAVFGPDNFRILCLYCEKMLQQYGDDIFTTDAFPYVQQLIELENVKRRASETFIWKTKLGLDLPLKDWGVSIWIDLKYDHGYVFLELQDDSAFNWHVKLFVSPLNQSYSQHHFSDSYQNELEMPAFSEYGVFGFPEWLKTLKQDYQFDWESVKISGLKKRADKQKLMQWLVSPFQYEN